MHSYHFLLKGNCSPHMLKKYIKRRNLVYSIFKTGNSRDRMLRKNILLSGLLKAVGLMTSLLIVPITLHYLNNEIYGIWLTMTSILYWFSFFDVGLGNGMRNYLTQSISENNYDKARAYLSTTFAILFGIALCMALIGGLALFALDMNIVFNTTTMNGTDLRMALLVASILTLANFVVKNIGFVFVAMQKYALYDFLVTTGSVLALLTIYILTRTTDGNLLYVVVAFTGIPVLVFLVACIPTFHKYPKLKPSPRSIDTLLGWQIINKGIGFFFIQITSCLIIYGASNLFITHYAGPKEVTTYNIAYKFFNLLAIAYTIIISPMWNAYTDAYVKKDMQWIGKTFHTAMRMWGLTVLCGVVMLGLCNTFYLIWIGKVVSVPLSLSLCVLAYICMFNLNCGVTYLLNGLNKIRVQIITSVVITFVYLLTVCLLGEELGTKGIILSMAASYGVMALIHFYQCHLLIKCKAKGIWNK